MTEALKQQLQTPCIVIDMELAKKNIQMMQEEVNQTNATLRPHIKTHKMVSFAKMQVAAGAKGITCAKLSEAEIMAEGGLDDIFLAYPLIGPRKLERLPALQQKCKRLILAVDSLACGEGLSNCAVEHDLIFEVRLEVDTGAKRTGIQTDLVALAKKIAALPNLSLTGIFTFKSLVYQNKATTNPQEAAIEEGELMEAIAKELKEAGISLQDISAGSSPTGVLVAKTGKVTEVRPGTYIFKDYMLYCEESAELSQVAVRVYATVVSTPCEDYAVIDGGTKTFPMDILLDQAPYFYSGYAMVQGHPHLELKRMNEEHGILTSKEGPHGLKVGDIIELMPIHVCTAVNLQNEVYLLEEESLTLEKVEGRGALW